MGFNIDLLGEFAIAQHFNEVLGRNEAGSYEVFDTNFLKVLGFSQCLDCSDIDSLVLYAIDVLKTMLGKTALKRHLTTFKTNLLAVTGTLLGTLVTTSRSAAHTGTGTATNSLARFC